MLNNLIIIIIIIVRKLILIKSKRELKLTKRVIDRVFCFFPHYTDRALSYARRGYAPVNPKEKNRRFCACV